MTRPIHTSSMGIVKILYSTHGEDENWTIPGNCVIVTVLLPPQAFGVM